MAIRSALDVYGENVRVVVPIDSVAHGRVIVICVGAMMVGSTVITRRAGEKVGRAEELGYFKFGGSTLLLLFEPGTMKFDDDLVDNSLGALETLVSLSTLPPGHGPFPAGFVIVLTYHSFVLACPSATTRNNLNTNQTCEKPRPTSLKVNVRRQNVGSRAALPLVRKETPT
jgi:hypothetical protein